MWSSLFHTSSVWYPFTHPLIVSSVCLFMRWKEPLRTTQHFLDPALNLDHVTRVETHSHMILLQQSFCSKSGEWLVRVQHPALCQFDTANTHMTWWANVYPQNTHARPINQYTANKPPVSLLCWHSSLWVGNTISPSLKGEHNWIIKHTKYIAD